MTRLARATWPVILMALWLGCDTPEFKAGTAVQSGRQALLRKDCAQALPHFEEAARINPNYSYVSARFKQGIWSYVGRCQYAAGNWPQARQSLELAITRDGNDLMARLFLGLTLLRSGDAERGAIELRGALQSLHDWIERDGNRNPSESYWDPNKTIRGEIKKILAALDNPSGDRGQIQMSAEWIGAEFEEEVEKVRREESRRQ